MCLFTWLGIRCTSPFPGVLKIQLDCVHSKKKQLDKTRIFLKKTLKNYSSDNPHNVYILKLTII